MNIENMTKLRDWLAAGAPHVRFDMDTGVTIEEGSGVGDCGTVCCIAGAAALMSVNGGVIVKDYDDVANELHVEGGEADWFKVEYAARHWLELPDNNGRYGHDLFDPELAPDGCTPAQAAEAVTRVMNGEQPWPYI